MHVFHLREKNSNFEIVHFYVIVFNRMAFTHGFLSFSCIWVCGAVDICILVNWNPILIKNMSSSRMTQPNSSFRSS